MKTMKYPFATRPINVGKRAQYPEEATHQVIPLLALP